jgi:pimeloyl-ACP methyl ester carboxylesterase
VSAQIQVSGRKIQKNPPAELKNQKLRRSSMKKPFLINTAAGLLALRTVAVAAVVGLAAVSPAHAWTDKAVTCQSATIPVALAPGQPASYTASGELCAAEDERVAGTTMQLLIHGATYTHDYWDFGRVDENRYSYARDVAAHGFPTFAIDLLGSGDSSHPPSDQLTAQSDAFVAHQIVQALRNGLIAGVQFGKVIIVGHSSGSVVVWEEAITYGDADGVIVTGAAHSLATRFVTSGDLYPAMDDPKFAHSGLDAGYLTTKPGTRATLFYSSPDADPAVIAMDEARKDVVSASELNTVFPIVTSTDTLAIQVPVLDILGSNDFTTCGLSTTGATFDCSSGAAVATQEVPFYSPQARIHACVVPASGHDVNLAVNHELTAADAVAWSAAFVGQLNEKRDFDGYDNSYRGLPWNDGLPWNCGGIISAESE